MCQEPSQPLLTEVQRIQLFQFAETLGLDKSEAINYLGLLEASIGHSPDDERYPPSVRLIDLKFQSLVGSIFRPRAVALVRANRRDFLRFLTSQGFSQEEAIKQVDMLSKAFKTAILASVVAFVRDPWDYGRRLLRNDALMTYYDHAERYARAILSKRPNLDPCDAIQQLSTELWRRPLDSLILEPKAFVLGACRKQCIKMIKRNPSLSTPISPEVEASESDDIRRMDAELDYECLLSKLPVSSRQIIQMHFHGDLTIQEIAKLIGKSQATVRSRLHDALERLRNMMK